MLRFLIYLFISFNIMLYHFPISQDNIHIETIEKHTESVLATIPTLSVQFTPNNITPIEEQIIQDQTNEEAEIENIEVEEIETSEVDETINDVDETSENYIAKDVPSDSSFKSYMSYRAITNKSSKQYQLQQAAITGNYGIRTVDDRYCIALGTYYSSEVGTKVDVVMKNGAIIECILGDVKANKHTDANNIKTADGSVVEFIVDSKTLHSDARKMGDLSYADDMFAGEISEIRIYEDM